MAAYTNLTKKDANLLAAEYGLPKVVSVRTVREGSVNTHYLLETGRGKFVVKIDEVKSEIEVKRELDLLLFLRKHGFRVRWRWLTAAAATVATGVADSSRSIGTSTATPSTRRI
jgi:Ser/Thr protein kinase RdoA (MazF antagonist)